MPNKPHGGNRMKGNPGCGLSMLLLAGMCFPVTGADVNPAVAETAGEESVVVVTASRQEVLLQHTPEIVQVINHKRIATLKPSKTGEILEQATGVALFTGTGSGLSRRNVVSLNGLPPKYTLVLVDGFPLLSEHIHTGQNVELVPAHLLERVEIVRGTGGAQYGSDAIGGVVNLITRKAGDRSEGSLRVLAGSYNTFAGDVMVLQPLNDAVRATAAVSWEQSDGMPLLAPESRVGNTGYEQFNMLGRLDADLGDLTKMYSRLGWVEHSMDWQGGTTDSRQFSPAMGMVHSFSDLMRLYTEMAYSAWEADLNVEENTLWLPKAYVIHDFEGEHSLMGGVDFKRNTFQRRAVVSRAREDYGVFAQGHFQTMERLQLMGALRFDKVEHVDGVVSPKGALLFTPVNGVGVRGSIGRGFHAPSLMELYEEGFGHGGRAYRFGNPELNPEYSTTYDISVELAPSRKFQMMLHGFLTRFEDMIVPVYEGAWDKDPSKDVWRRVNINNASVHGAEVAATVRPLGSLAINGGYTWTDNEDRETGRPLPSSPGSSVFGRLEISTRMTPEMAMLFFVNIRRMFDREVWSWKPAPEAAVDNTDGLTTPLKDYTKLDAGVTWSLGPVYEIFIKGENLLGEDIEQSDDAYTLIYGDPMWCAGFTYKW